jgi:DNA ligase-associated metallophosphoesterase
MPNSSVPARSAADTKTPVDGCSGLAIVIAGETLVLLPDHAVWWPSQQTLLIADTHFGKEATFRAAAIPVPDQTAELLARLSTLISATAASRLIVLGDLIHARQGRCAATFERVSEWRRENLGNLEMLLVRGNHDLAAGDPPRDWQIRCVADPFSLAPFSLTHVPPSAGNGTGAGAGGSSESAALAGHLHPVVRLRGPARDSLRLPCFLLKPHVLVLPAFSSFVDGKVTGIEPGDRVFAVADRQVLEISQRPAGGR